MDTRIKTKMKINKPVAEVFEAIVSPEQIGGYWFSESTGRLEEGKNVTLKYEEYNAEGEMNVLHVEQDKELIFSWGETQVSIMFHATNEDSTMIEVTETGLSSDDPDVINKMMGQKEGWVYMLTCLKGYLENGITTLRASLVH
ncbi:MULTISPECIES: SRPBCC family protein [Sporosarcina]|uniref:SRPBCC family protein n=1 Tax=Sporosarcina contaminans TaxID=633403 RepID=A0ABW3U0P6_9BACL